MSDLGSGLVKLAYRGLAGFFVILFLFVFGVTGFALSLAGGLAIALCWVPIAFPELLDAEIIWAGSAPVTDPALASLLILIVGLVLLAVGFFFLAITFVIGKAAIIVDKELSSSVDKAFATSRRDDRISRLERLAALRDRGMITPEEFEQEKAIILAQSDPYGAAEAGKGEF